MYLFSIEPEGRTSCPVSENGYPRLSKCPYEGACSPDAAGFCPDDERPRLLATLPSKSSADAMQRAFFAALVREGALAEGGYVVRLSSDGRSTDEG